jgi:RNA polymerase sigma-70 factor (ECF subfamily)
MQQRLSGIAAHPDVPAEGKSAPMFGFEDSMTLSELVLAAQGGSEEAFTQLIELHRSRIRYWAYCDLGDWNDADDVVQDVSVRAWQRLDQLEKPEALAGWLKTITCRIVYGMKQRRALQLDGDLTAVERMESREGSSFDSLLVKDTQQEVQEGLQRLGDLDRATLVAFYFDEMTIQEMSVVFGAPEGTIKRRLHVARHRLAEKVQSSNSV